MLWILTSAGDTNLKGLDLERAAREQQAYDEGDVDETMARWHGRFPHVFASPNTVRHERIFDRYTEAAVAGQRVVDLGCGPGASSRRLLRFGAARVIGIDVSRHEIEKASAYALPGKLDFIVGDATRSLNGTFGAIFGRSILHHLDFRGFLPRIYEENLAPGGTMLFMEPLGSNLMVRMYGLLVPSAHTSDEQSLQRDDLEWFKNRFSNISISPINYVTFPAAILTSVVCPRNADNALLRWADRVDERLSRRSRLVHRFRQASIIIRKPGGR
jgi:SAM-dependent methyltransferase